MKNIKAFTGSLEPYSLSNFIHNSNCDAAEFKLALEETNKAGDFVKVANKYTGMGWRVVKDSDGIVQIQTIDSMGNKRYIKAEKTDNNMKVYIAIALYEKDPPQIIGVFKSKKQAEETAYSFQTTNSWVNVIEKTLQ